MKNQVSRSRPELASIVLVVLAWPTIGCTPQPNTTSQAPGMPVTEQPDVATTVSEASLRPSALTPVMKADDGGGLHLAWMESRPAKSSILYSQWKEGRWSSPTSVSKEQISPLFPEIAVGSTGEVHLTWIERVEHDADVYHSQLSNGGWTKPTKVCDTEGMSQRPHIAVGADGVAHVVWYDNSDGSFELFHSHLRDSGWSEATDTQLVNLFVTHDPGMGMMPGLTIDHDGSVHIAYVNLGRGVMDLFHSRWDGTTWSEQENITQYTAPRGETRTFTDAEGVGHVTQGRPPKPSQPEIEVDAAGNIYVAWENRGEVWYSKSDGKRWSNPFRLSDGNATSLWPVLRLTPDGGVHVTWTSSVKERTQVFYRYFGDDWSVAKQVTKPAVGGAFSAHAIDNEGSLHFAWMKDSNGSYDIVHQFGLLADEINQVSAPY